MNDTFVVALRRAGVALRNRNLMEARNVLQAAFNFARPAGTAEGGAAAVADAEETEPAQATGYRGDRLADWPMAAPMAAPGAAQGFAEADDHWQGEGAPDLEAPSVQRSLRDAVRLLRDGRKALEPITQPDNRLSPEEIGGFEIPRGAGFHSRRFSCKAGERDYRLFVPALPDGRAAGLILMLHGCTQTPEEFAAGTRMNTVAEQLGLIVAYPEQTTEHSAMQCWNWFRTGDQIRGAGEPAVLAGLVEHLRAEFDCPEDRVFVAGLSAGGAMAAILGDAYPELFAAVGIHSGVAPGSAWDVLSAFAAMRGEHFNGVKWRLQKPGVPSPRIIVFHGDADRVVHPSNARRIIGAARALFPEGETYTETGSSEAGRGYRKLTQSRPDGTPLIEAWMVEGVGHAWSGGMDTAPHTDAAGPDATREMIRFFLG